MVWVKTKEIGIMAAPTMAMVTNASTREKPLLDVNLFHHVFIN
jgi:hypothetical protein